MTNASLFVNVNSRSICSSVISHAYLEEEESYLGKSSLLALMAKCFICGKLSLLYKYHGQGL